MSYIMDFPSYINNKYTNKHCINYYDNENNNYSYNKNREKYSFCIF